MAVVRYLYLVGLTKKKIIAWLHFSFVIFLLSIITNIGFLMCFHGLTKEFKKLNMYKFKYIYKNCKDGLINNFIFMFLLLK